MSANFNITQYTLEEQKRMAELLERDRKWANRAKRDAAKRAIILKKAVAAKIEATDAEIDAYLAAHKK